MLLNPASMKEKSIDVMTDMGAEDQESSVKKSANSPPKFTRVFEMVLIKIHSWSWRITALNLCYNYRKKIVKPQQ